MKCFISRHAPLLILLLPQFALASVCYQVQSQDGSSPESLCVTPRKSGGIYKISEDPSLSQAEKLSGKNTAYYQKKGNLFVKVSSPTTPSAANAPDSYHFDMPLGAVGGIQIQQGGKTHAVHVLAANTGTYDNRLRQITLLSGNDQVCPDCGSANSEVGIEKQVVEKTARDAIHVASAAGSLPTKVDLPDGIRFIIDSAADPLDPQTMYAVGERQGLKAILKSTDGGKHWSEVSALGKEYGFAELYVHIAVSPGGKDIFFNSENNLAWNKGKVFHSSDGGKTFTSLDNYDAASPTVQFSPDGKTLMVALIPTGSQVKDPSFQDTVQYVKSGDSWVRSSPQLPSLAGFIENKRQTDPRCTSEDGDNCPYAHPDIQSLAYDPRDPQVVYAGTGNHVYRYTPDQGWEVLSNGVYNDTTVYNVQIVPKTNQIVFSGCNGVYRTTASARSESVRFSKYTSPNFIIQGQGTVSTPNYQRAYGVAVNPDHPEQIVSVTASGIYVSRDSGKTWNREVGGELQDRDAKGFTEDFRTVKWLPDGSVLVSGDDAGTYNFTP